MSPENRLSALAQAQESVNASSKARERLALLFDKDTFVELDTFAKADGETSQSDVSAACACGASIRRLGCRWKRRCH